MSDPGSAVRGSAVVGLVMGSDSDWPVMEDAAKVLEEFDIAYEADVVSAHRMPDEMLAVRAGRRDRGLLVIIASAGGAAPLPGMLASLTPLPVIGVLIPLSAPRRVGLVAVHRADACGYPRGDGFGGGRTKRRAVGSDARLGDGWQAPLALRAKMVDFQIRLR